MAKKSSTKKSSTKSSKSKNLNETGVRKCADRRKDPVAAADFPNDRRKTKRRRQIDPTTCEREYNDGEIEFMHALDEYKRASGRMFPTCSEILEVIVGLGYRKVAEATEGFAFEKDNDSVSDLDNEFDEETMEKELEDQLI